MAEKSKAETVLDALRASGEFGPNFVVVKRIRGSPASYEDFPDWIDAQLVAALRKKGIDRLYSHQREAVELIAAGRNVCLVTPTASGKTLAYNLPVMNELMSKPDVRSLYIFPTKALAQDQLKEFLDIADSASGRIKAHTYDGDTPADVRRSVRLSAHVVITNPDMLHTGILPHHTKWNRFFANLRYVVLDELHIYRGVFGSHVANLMRRLKRVCRFYGAKPVFICCSATVANPKEHAENLIEEEFELVDKSGAPTADRIFAFYNPPVVNRALGMRANFLNEAKRLAIRFVESDVSTIVFATSRLNVEVLTRYLKERFDRDRLPHEQHMVSGYRGGYLPELRRSIERGLKDGTIRCVVSTNALELGIDIGRLEACIVAGYPGTIASMWQQAGRAGRRRETSVVIFVARSHPLDQYIVNRPDYFFGSSPERCLVNPDNLAILLSHVQAASFELPFDEGERFGNADVSDILDVLDEKGIVHKSGGRYHWTSDSYPADSVSLRSATPDNFVVLDSSRKPPVAIGEVDYRSAFIYLHPGAIYMVESDTYHIDELDIESRRALASPVSVDYYTDAMTHALIRILDV
ncbi:MAG TPA: DEAD/DEAH box helicase, partial [Proteobacteria bacterium]|nr:DEAD/DEAH box helicase [Pseudomonadota bacterium]